MDLLFKFFRATRHSSPVTRHIKKLFLNPWIISLCLLAIFLAVNGYTYGWDDQHVEIPLLKKLIDPALYPGDYYVDALKQNFTSFLYPLLSKVITINQIPTVYFFLYLISRYFLLFFMFKLWHFISNNKGMAFLAVLMIFLIGRVEEFLYRTFSHQEFALAFVFAGFYLFYKKRYLLSSILFGLATNFNALYSLFPMCYLGFYLLWQRKWKDLLKASAGFLILAMPFLIWNIAQRFTGGSQQPSQDQWIPLYQLACPQNFLFHHSNLAHVFSTMQNFINGTAPYWLLAGLTLLHSLFNPIFQKDKKAQSVLIVGWLLLIFSFIFSYIIPIRFMLDLNLIRNEQFMLFFLMGYFIVLLWSLAQQNIWKFFVAMMIVPLIRFGSYQAALSVFMLIPILMIKPVQKPWRFHHLVLPGFLIIMSAIPLYFLIIEFTKHSYSFLTLLNLAIAEAVILASAGLYFFNPKLKKHLIVTAMIAPFLLTTFNFVYYHQRRLNIEKEGTGFWQLQRNWIDMQNYVRENTSKESILLVPHDMEMGGFRIHSERSIVMSYRDCGVVGFDYQAGEEWQKRLNTIGSFQVFIKEPVAEALFAAIVEYEVDYIVFMNYFHLPDNPGLTKIYQNEAFKLYKVNR